jgi:ABC-type glycerol-3-phosphate transport system substrate-binding protein
MSTKMLLVAACLLLAGCGGSRNDTAADACSQAITEKLAGKTFTLDRKDMAARAKDESADTVLIGSTITFDKGLSTEYQQTFDCRVRLGKTADVIFLQFNWRTDDLKKAKSQ